MVKTNSYRDLVKFGVENSSTPVSKAAQGSKQHKVDVLTYVNKVVADQKIFKNNINRKPTYPTQASPEAVGKLAESMERHRQQTGQESTWNAMKATAKTPQEKKEIRDIIKEDYKKHGATNMSDADLKWIGRVKSQQPIRDFKIDADGISSSLNNFILTTRQNVPVAPPKKQRDPDLNLGLGSILGETYDS